MQQNCSNRAGQGTGEFESSSSRRQRDGGFLLLAILLMMAMMIIAATIVAPRVVQQIKRDREEEMIHRGTEYARAIKKYYKKFGSYPTTLEQLDNTNQIRFLRKRYKDPLTKDGKWKLLNYGDIAMLLNTAGPGTPAASLAGQNGLTPGGAIVPGGASAGSATPYSSSQQQQSNPFAPGFASPSSQGNQDPNVVASPNQNQTVGTQSSSANSATGSQPGSAAFGQSGALGSNQPGSNPAGNSPFGQNTTGGAQTFGGGAIVGVASMSKDPTIRVYNKKKTYNEWQFIYNPMMDVQNVLLRGPYQPTTIGGAQIGTPASQMNGQSSNGQQQNGFGQQQNGFGQQPNGFGQQPGGLGQQPNVPQSPGGFPSQQNPQQ